MHNKLLGQESATIIHVNSFLIGGWRSANMNAASYGHDTKSNEKLRDDSTNG